MFYNNWNKNQIKILKRIIKKKKTNITLTKNNN